jgi:molybdopterin synthase sulfur carrier subunit
MIRVELPLHLRRLAGLAGTEARVLVEVATVRGVLDALETLYPMLRGTIRDQATGERRAFLRFFACQEDLSLLGMDVGLPEAVVAGEDVLIVLGAVAGGRGLKDEVG